MDMKRFEGLTVEDLKAAISEMEKAEEAKAREEKAKKEAKLDEARLAMLDAAVQYLLLMGAVDEEEVKTMDVSKTLAELKEAEDQLIQYIKFVKRVPFSVPKIKIREIEDGDIDIIKKFLSNSKKW